MSLVARLLLIGVAPSFLAPNSPELTIPAEQVAIVKSFTAMKKSKKYIEEMVEITETLNSELPQEEKKWWSKEKY